MKKIRINWKKNRKVIIASGAAALLGLSVLLLLLVSAELKLHKTVAFYDLPEKYEDMIRPYFSDVRNSRNKRLKVKCLTLDSSQPLKKQLKKIDMVFTNYGAKADEAVATIDPKNRELFFADSSCLRGSSMAATQKGVSTFFSGNGRISMVPILFDGYELLLSKKSLYETQSVVVHSWGDVEAFARRSRNFCVSPVAFAGGDDDSLLGVMSALIESFEGTESYEELVRQVRNYKGSVNDLVKEVTREGKSMHEALKRLCLWKREGLLNAEIMNLGKDDLMVFLDSQRNAVTILPLSEHRRIDSSIVQDYTTIPIYSNESFFYFPGMRAMNTRAVISPVVCGISFTKDQALKSQLELLTRTEAQEDLSRRSGIAPLLANCRIPDIQADDVRFWIAATSRPLTPMGQAAFSSDSRKKEFCDAIRTIIKTFN